MKWVVSVVFCCILSAPILNIALAQTPSKKIFYRRVFHRVKTDENLYRISLRYNKSLRQLRYWNNLSDISKIREGQILIVGYLKPKMPSTIGNISPKKDSVGLKSKSLAQPDSSLVQTKKIKQQVRKPDSIKTTAPALLPIRFNEVPAKKNSFQLPRQFKDLDLKQKVMVSMVLLFITIAFTVLVSVFTSRLIKSNRAFQTKSLQKKYEELLMEVLFTEEEDLMSETSPVNNPLLKNSLNNPFNRRVLITEIIRLHKNFSGNFAQNLEKFYLQLGLEQDSFKKLKSKRWYIKAQGISELAEMNVSSAAPAIEKYIEHTSELVRLGAQLAILKLSEENILGFLDHIKTPLTDWHQLNLQQILSHKDRDKIPEFSRWLHSENNSIVEFSVKMVGLYNQVSAIPLLVQLLQHPEFKVKLATIQALQKLDASEALTELEAAFYRETNKELKLAIIKALENIGYDQISFFEKELTSYDFDICLAAAKAIVNLKHNGEEYFNELHKSADPQLQSIINHVLDPRI